MERAVLEALLKKWEKDCEPQPQDGSPEAQIGNAKIDGFKKGVMTCREDLESLIQLLMG